MLGSVWLYMATLRLQVYLSIMYLFLISTAELTVRLLGIILKSVNYEHYLPAEFY